ncbi:beta-ketoacyl synthase N-terminal-like domain-containing protein [Micromonospora sp. WMMD714]|uniref:beta-ketoacyl synthase N-terminal-like domain-containing protein n=1 Tax=Micromonospora sp. WMMD714 TaxID=3016097 RepID=UPI00249BBE3B|nr:beta-ketoacyl synthase N-terminal-like domain-containing protein [Micromonospora sp. WMMD714]WFE63706.1 beta-ketoacyl synthase N-terminal-like domain-containing protein [Micromonospora sp. WMMD714]
MDSTQLRALVEEQLRQSRALRARIRELEQERHTPLAVVGMALRFPGGISTPEAYWDLLDGTGEVACEIPADRPGLRAAYHPEVGRVGRSYVRRAGFLRDVAGFDADFFGISNREAESLDPQQRLLLETSWEALERAGIAVRRGGRLDAGVYVGIMASEYGQRFTDGDPERLDPYYGTGGGHCFAAGRISYALGLRGPAVSIDTACSSSLVALHSAARALRGRECRYALVGGANLLFSPQLMVSLCQSRAVAPDGRSKPFLDGADGYGRGEGVATVVVMRLDDALAEDRPVLAVLRGTAVNHDGASSGLTVPNGPAQQEVILAALRDADVAPAQVSYLEAHGTGTSLGDPIEAAALHGVFGRDRPAGDPLRVGSVKARLGHLEAAAGMAALIKVVLMLRHGRLVADVPPGEGPLNPLIPWSRQCLEVVRAPRDWTGERFAGISAFGLSGTNAHVVLQSAPAPAEHDEPGGPGGRAELLVLSARTEPALRTLAATVSTRLYRADDRTAGSICHTLRSGRTPMGYRIAVTGGTARELARALSNAVDLPATAVTEVPREVLLHTGDPVTLAAAVRSLADRFPGLGEPGGDPAAWLTAALAALGVPVRSAAGPTGADAAVVSIGTRRVVLVPADPLRAEQVFLDALAQLFRAGVDLHGDPLRTPGVRYLPDLPTYPFQRRRHWVDEPRTGRFEATAPVVPPLSAAVSPAAMAPPTVSPAVVSPAAGTDAIVAFLRDELAAALKADELDLAATFADLGGDSFTAMLFVRSVEDRFATPDMQAEFAVDRPLTELLGELAAAIAARSAADPVSAAAGVAGVRMAPVGAGAGADR